MSDIPLVSLCIIVGNEEVYIHRFLESFKGVYDELCAVRACGSVVPDRTLDILKDAGAIVGEYKNRKEFADWPHTDDFSAARQQAYMLASGTYCLWADADDIIDEASKQNIRTHAGKGEADCYLYPYSTGNDHKVWRRKLVRRQLFVDGRAYWLGAVHEDIAFQKTPITAMNAEGVEFTHAPDKFKQTSLDRNIRMISHQISHTHEGLYYLQQDYFRSHQYDKAMPMSKAALAMPDLPQCNRYEVLLNIANMIVEKAPDESRQYCLQAVGVDPSRREALCMLACISIDAGRNEEALAYARMFNKLPYPERNKPWNLKLRFYDWLGVHIFAQAQRLNGFEDQAIENENAMFKSAGAWFSLIHATQGRHEMAQATRNEWFVKADEPKRVEHIFAIDHYDTKSLRALAQHRHVVCTPGGSCNVAFNEAAKVATGKILIAVADDNHPPQKWDKLILEALGDKAEKEAVLFVGNGFHEKHPTRPVLQTSPVLTRARYEKQGHVFGPYPSMYADNEFTWRALQDGIVIERTDIEIEHRHPMYGKNGAVQDDTYASTNDQTKYDEGYRLFIERNTGVMPL